MEANINLVVPGTQVKYHGSLRGYHGLMEVENFHFPFETLSKTDVIRYVLRYGPNSTDYLRNVRPESFTVQDS